MSTGVLDLVGLHCMLNWESEQSCCLNKLKNVYQNEFRHFHVLKKNERLFDFNLKWVDVH